MVFRFACIKFGLRNKDVDSQDDDELKANDDEKGGPQEGLQS